MAEQICPNCRAETFTWMIDEEKSLLTIWGCRTCNYSAYEDESFERNCSDCGAKTEIRLEDGEKKYWWCSKCNRTTIINDD